MSFQKHRIPRKLDLGKHYLIWFDPNKKMICKFIKTTKCGFNFLHLDSNTCVLPNHLYQMKDHDGVKRNTFYTNKYLKIN